MSTGDTNASVQIATQGAQGITPVPPSVKLHCERCEGRLVLGMFFDGTGNSRHEDLPSKSHSNVARLFAAYQEDTNSGLTPRQQHTTKSAQSVHQAFLFCDSNDCKQTRNNQGRS